VGELDGSTEYPRAFVVLQPGAKLDQEAIQEYSRTRLAKYKIPQDVVFVQTIPKNPTGKILRRELREKQSSSVRIAA
jgi:fatty-acyl-CoA synthase